MVNEADILGELGFGLSLKFTPDAGEGAEITLASILSATPAKESVARVNYTPLDGDRAGVERVVAGKFSASESTAKVTYDPTQHALVVALKGKHGTYTLTFADGATCVGIGILADIAVSELNDTALITADLTFALDGDAGWAAGT